MSIKCRYCVNANYDEDLSDKINERTDKISDELGITMNLLAKEAYKSAKIYHDEIEPLEDDDNGNSSSSFKEISNKSPVWKYLENNTPIAENLCKPIYEFFLKYYSRKFKMKLTSLYLQ